MKYLLFLLVPYSLFSQQIPTFPADFQGIWAGELQIFTPLGLRQKVAMQLHILPLNDSTLTYTIYYGDDLEKGKRNYLLRQGHEGPHHWIVDEQDGILLDNFYLGGVLQGPFSVAGTLLFSTLSLVGEQLAYTISSGPEKSYRNSSSSVTEEDETTVYEVASFAVRNYQRALLSRKREAQD